MFQMFTTWSNSYTGAKVTYPHYRFTSDNPLRSHQQTLDDVKYYLCTGKNRNGVLGPSWLGSLKYHDSARGTAVDYMHCCLLGVVRRMLNLWLNSQNHNKPYYIGNFISLLDNLLLSIKPISDISRAPRSVSDWKHWKASEFRSSSYERHITYKSLQTLSITCVRIKNIITYLHRRKRFKTVY